MTQNEKHLLLRDLCGRLPYGVKLAFYASATKQTITCTLLGLEPQEDEPVIAKTENGSFYMLADHVKPYLIPISSMTEEQVNECQQIKNSYYYHDDAFILFEFYDRNHIDYRGLIPMGIAEDATGLNIY